MASSNVVILLIGLHGVGKSTFTRAATGRGNIELGRGIGPCTMRCNTYAFDYAVQSNDRSRPQNLKFTIIDTPGLADKNTKDENLEVLQNIADQLRTLGQEQVSGVIYFHSIQNVRLHGVDMDNLRLLQAISGASFFHRVAFVTTRWDCMEDSEYDTLVTRHNELVEALKRMFPSGPGIFTPFHNDGESHRHVLNYFARKGIVAEEPLLFAKELESYKRRRLSSAVKHTTAGKELTSKKKVRKGGICSFL
ncbi:P-loop containing nucleoside triphosphate hydrolase protein [Naviculisporaceae sp. PSN 640]